MLETKRADWYFVIPASLIFFFALIVIIWDFIVIQRMEYHFNLISLLGLILGVIGFAIRRLAKKTLGENYSYGLKPPERLITHGIYKYVRHPIYLSAFFTYLAIPLFFNSLYGLILIILIFPLIFYRINIEEDILIEKFGDEYLKYMKNTKKLIPFIY